MIGPQQPTNSSQPAGGKAVLIAYDDSDSEPDEKLAEQDPSKLSSKGQEHTTDDILALLEAEKPPDYVAPEMNNREASTAAVNGGSAMVHGTSANSGFQPPTNQFAAPPPSVPVRRPQLGSMLQLACNYGHESGSDEEDEVVEKNQSKKKVMDGQLDSAGRMFFTETREQKEAKERQKEKERKEEEMRRDAEAKSGAGGGRKKRLALPGGRPRFNKADLVTDKVAEEQEKELEEKMLRYMEYQRHQSPSPEQPAQGDNDTTATSATEAPIAPAAVEPKLLTDAEQASEEAAELVEKLEYFKVAEEKVSTLKTLAIKLETLYTAWSAGALSLSYLSATLASSKKLLAEAELGLVEAPWKPNWDRSVTWKTSGQPVSV